MEALFQIIITLPERSWKRKFVLDGEKAGPCEKKGVAVCAGADGDPGRIVFGTQASLHDH